MAITGASEEVQVQIGGDASGIQEAGDNAAAALGSVKAAAGLAGAALASLAVGGLVAATSAAADFEEQMVDVEKVTNPQTARRMSSAIQDMAAEMPVAQGELAGIAEQAGRFGVEGSDNIRQFTETVAKMSVATDLSTQQAGESFARLSTLMDEPISKVGDMGNAINELSNNMATSSSEITDAALRSSGTLSQMGASSEDILALNAAMNEASESAERAGTRLRRLSQEIQNPKKVEEFASALGMSTAEFETMRSEEPTALFKRMAETMGEGGEASDALRSALSTTSQQALTGLSQNLEGLSDAQETANEQMEAGTSLNEEYEAASSTFNSELQVAKNRLRNVALQIGDNTLPVAADLLENINELIAELSEFNKESDGMAGTVALVATALGGFAVAVSSAISYLGGLSAVLGTVGSALTVLTGPVGVAIAAIALLAGAWATNLWDIRGHTKRAAAAVKRIVGDLVAVISKWWDKHGDEIVATARSTWTTVRNIVDRYLTFVWKNLIQPTLRAIGRLWRLHGKKLVSEARETWRVIWKRIKTVLNIIWTKVIKPTIALIEKAWARWGDELKTIAKGVFGAIELVVTQAMDIVLTTIRVTMALIRGDWSEAWSLIEDYLTRTWDRLVSFIKNDAKPDFVAELGILLDAAKAALNYLWGMGVGTLYNDVTGLLDDLATWVGTDGKQAISDAYDAVKQGAKDAFTYLTDTGEGTLIYDIKSRIVEAIQWINDKLPDELSFSIDVPSVDVGTRTTTVAGQDVEVPDVDIGTEEQSFSRTLPSFDVPQLNTGGMIEGAGMAMLHAGEEVVPAAEVDRDRSGGASVQADITVYAEDGTDAGKRIAKEMDRLL